MKFIDIKRTLPVRQPGKQVNDFKKERKNEKERKKEIICQILFFTN